jgi:hypothetical protein
MTLIISETVSFHSIAGNKPAGVLELSTLLFKLRKRVAPVKSFCYSILKIEILFHKKKKLTKN